MKNRCTGLFATVIITSFILSGCAHFTYPKQDVALHPTQIENIKTLEMIVVADEKPFTVDRQYYDDSSTIALRQVSGLAGAIAASVISSSANRQYAATAEAIRKQLVPVQEQVNDLNYVDLMTNSLKTRISADGQLQVVKVTGRPNENGTSQFRFVYQGGINDYSAKSEADAVVLILPTLSFYGHSSLVLTQKTRVWMMAKDGRTVFFGTALHSGAVPPTNLSTTEKIDWWSLDDRYRRIVLNSVDSTIEFINRKIIANSTPPENK